MADAPHELSITRLLHVTPAAVWQAWTGHLAEWWCPRPWTTKLVEADLRPGGRFATIMRGPAGEEHVNEGVFLEVAPERRIVFTDMFRAGWLPQDGMMLAVMEFAPEAGGTRYTATVRHWTAEARERHAAMGFDQGWGAVAGQLEAVAARVGEA